MTAPFPINVWGFPSGTQLLLYKRFIGRIQSGQTLSIGPAITSTYSVIVYLNGVTSTGNFTISQSANSTNITNNGATTASSDILDIYLYNQT